MASAQADGAPLRLDRPLTFDTVPGLLDLPARWPAGGPVTIDLAGVSRTDSAGLALLIEWVTRARRTGREIRFINIPPRLQDLMRVTGLQALFNGEKPAA